MLSIQLWTLEKVLNGFPDVRAFTMSRELSQVARVNLLDRVFLFSYNKTALCVAGIVMLGAAEIWSCANNVPTILTWIGTRQATTIIVSTTYGWARVRVETGDNRCLVPITLSNALMTTTITIHNNVCTHGGAVSFEYRCNSTPLEKQYRLLYHRHSEVRAKFMNYATQASILRIHASPSPTYVIYYNNEFVWIVIVTWSGRQQDTVTAILVWVGHCSELSLVDGTHMEARKQFLILF